MTLDEIEKSVNGKFPIGKVYKEPDLDTAEKISGVTATITPGGVGGLATSGGVVIAADGKSFSWIIEAGIAGIDYTVHFEVTSVASKIYAHPIREAVLVKVVS